MATEFNINITYQSMAFYFVAFLPHHYAITAYVFRSTNDIANLERMEEKLSTWHGKFPKFPTENFVENGKRPDIQTGGPKYSVDIMHNQHILFNTA